MAVHIIKGAGSPLDLGIIPPSIGTHFIDTVSKVAWISTGDTLASDWQLSGGPGSGFTYLSLADTESSYSGSAGLVATVNPGEDGLIFEPGGQVQSVFGRTGDILAVSGDYDADEIDETGTKVFLTPSEKAQIGLNSTAISNKPDDFLELDDTPISYPSGSAGFGLKVNDAEDGLEFTDGPTAAAGIGLSTSNLIGCEISINADNTLFDMEAGTGIHVDNTSTPGSPILTVVNIPQRLGNAVTNIGTQQSTSISIDISGNIIQAADQNTPAQRRDRFSVGVLIHTDLATIVDIAIAWSPGFDTHAQLNDLMEAIGFFLTGGNDISGVTSTLSIQKATGTGFARGANVDVNVNDPHDVILPIQNPITFFNLKQDGIVFGVNTFLDPTTYDNAGVLTTVPSNNNATIKYLFLFATGAMSVLTGQEVFASFSAAVDASGSETVIFPPILGSGIFMARIIMQKTATDTTDTATVRIVPTAAVASGGGGGAATTMQGGYDISVQPQVTLDAGSGGIEYRDAPTPIAVSLFKVSDNAGTTDFFNVEADKVTVVDLVSDGLTASRALVSDSSKKVVASATTSAEIGFVAGVTSSVQDQVDAKQDEITAGTTSQYFRGDKVFQELNKAAVGLANVDNTSDALKPISDATQTELDTLDGQKDKLLFGAITKALATTDGVTITDILDFVSSQVRIGNRPGLSGINSVHIGTDTNSNVSGTGTGSISIGQEAGSGATNSISIGTRAGSGDGGTQGNNAVALGNQCGAESQGTSGFAMGNQAGRFRQGTAGIAIGSSSGANDQGSNAVAISGNAGQFDQGANSVAVGSTAGQTDQGSNCVAIGNQAGKTTQGVGSVAIGRGCGNVSQGEKSLMISALNSNLNNTNNNAIHLESGDGSMIYNGGGVTDPMTFTMPLAYPSIKILDDVAYGGDMLTGTVTIYKSGDTYTVFGDVATQAVGSVNMDSAILIPVADRPTTQTVPFSYRVDANGIYRINIRTDGAIRFNQFDEALVAVSLTTSVGVANAIYTAL